jgi:hypothetical protein
MLIRARNRSPRPSMHHLRPHRPLNLARRELFCKKFPKILPLLKKFCSQGISVLSAVELTKIFCKFFQSRYGNVMGVTKVLKTLFCKNFV